MFEIRAYSTETMHYRVEVWFRGLLVEIFERPTMREAEEEFKQAGYIAEKVWKENGR